jgi:hypothetical protein
MVVAKAWISADACGTCLGEDICRYLQISALAIDIYRHLKTSVGI